MTKLYDIKSLIRLLVLSVAIHGGYVTAAEQGLNEAGIAPYPAPLAEKIRQALAQPSPGREPRTEHLDAQGAPRFTNRLILEASPYLRQHAHNPVDWYPWGAEAFAAAEKQNKPVFLSIGYSTCHWCHVMERESFDNLEIARYMNAHFIAIKVDREQNPDVDRVYMAAVMMLNGEGGWPLNSVLTPAGKTIYGASYFPPDQFLDFLKRMQRAWRDRRGEILQRADTIAGEVKSDLETTQAAAQIDQAVIGQAVDAIMKRYDDLAGGFGTVPKFPNENYLLLLLERIQRGGDRRLLSAVDNSLAAMGRGGIYDQIGGGFHRYATDIHWRIPHFEKMLYNQANLARIYLAGYALTGNRDYLRIVRQTLDYVLREMTADAGGFYSAMDAESEGREGAFYLWTPEQIRGALNKNDADLVIDLYNVKASGRFDGANLPYLSQPLTQYAKAGGYSLPDLTVRLEAIRQQLLEVRDGRPRPERDEKVVTAWNGMMITALARAGAVLGEDKYLQAAKRAAAYLGRYNQRGARELWRSSFHGTAAVPALQEDYACLAEGLIALYDASADGKWLAEAGTLADAMLQKFWDERSGGFFMNSGSPGVGLMARPKDKQDTAMASGNAVALRVLSALARRTGEDRYRKQADATLAAFSGEIKDQPLLYTSMLAGADELLQGETGPRQYAARGRVALRAGLRRGKGKAELAVTMDIKPGWHVNAHQVLNKDLIPTVISIDENEREWKLERIDYPAAKLKRLGFAKDRLAIYEGGVVIRASLDHGAAPEADAAKLLPVRISLQACSDKVCLLPETVTLQISTAL